MCVEGLWVKTFDLCAPRPHAHLPQVNPPPIHGCRHHFKGSGGIVFHSWWSLTASSSAGEHPVTGELRAGLSIPHHRVLLEDADGVRHRLRDHRHGRPRLHGRRVVEN